MISSFPKVKHGFDEPSTTMFSNTKTKNIEILNDFFQVKLLLHEIPVPSNSTKFVVKTCAI